MLGFTRGRSFTLHQTMYDYQGGPVSDLSHITTAACQIRGKTATKVKGNWVLPLIGTVPVTLSGTKKEHIALDLTISQSMAFKDGDYTIDIMGLTENGDTVSLMDPEPIRIFPKPTALDAGDIPAEAISIPDFTQQFETALQD